MAFLLLLRGGGRTVNRKDWDLERKLHPMGRACYCFVSRGEVDPDGEKKKQGRTRTNRGRRETKLLNGGSFRLGGIALRLPRGRRGSSP